jgi:hypothetical protein
MLMRRNRAPVAHSAELQKQNRKKMTERHSVRVFCIRSRWVEDSKSTSRVCAPVARYMQVSGRHPRRGPRSS